MLKKLIKNLTSYNKILVTGPQRSGTTIAANILAAELGYQYCDERSVNVRSLTGLFKLLLSTKNLVIQGPCFSSLVHWIDTPSTSVVIMRRDIKEIKHSQARINWKHEKDELKNYFVDKGVISSVKYANWEKYQKPRMKVPWAELEYLSLARHSM